MSGRGSSDGWSRRRRSAPKAEVEIADEVTVDVSTKDVLTRLRDAEFVAGCLPGLVPGSLQRRDDGVYLAQMQFKAVGVTATWELEVNHDASPDVSGIRISMAGKDPKLGLTMHGNADVDVSSVEQVKSRLDYKGNILVEGRLAATGGPLIRRIVDDILERFMAAITAHGEIEEEAPRKNGAIAALSAKARKLIDRLRRRFRSKQPPDNINRNED